MRWRTAASLAFADARRGGKGVLLDNSARWCLPCGKLAETMANPAVAEAINTRFIPLRLDITNGTDATDRIQQTYRAETLPEVIFLDSNGRELGRIEQYVGPEAFLEAIDLAAATVRGR